MKCNICVIHSKYGTTHYMLQFLFGAKFKNLKTEMCYDSFHLLSLRCRMKRNTKLFNHSFRTFAILTFFPLKILNCLCCDVWQRAGKKCEFDMILIFKLHILLLFLFTIEFHNENAIVERKDIQSERAPRRGV